MTDDPEHASGHQVQVRRIVPASRDRVFRAFTDPAQASRWYGPMDHTVPVCEMEARTEGRFRICMRSPSGTECWDEGCYRELAAPSRLAADYTVRLDGHAPVRLAYVVTFEDVDGHTRLAINQSFLPGHFTEGAEEGWNQALDRLETFLLDSAGLAS